MKAGNFSYRVKGKGDPYPKLVMGKVTLIQLLFPKKPTVPGTVIGTREQFQT